ncbi:MAG: bifunctional enoyl-CoA hydratase/phosphate acetyltransferase, partial [Chloroflexales bacterium]|nr:bifunctional enoyl-CoA hydratase/phosphate acetyltransferase [Chloroflexales bacterium]
LNGAPLSYWSGVDGKSVMRYMGGLWGGAWPTSLLSDLGNDRFGGSTAMSIDTSAANQLIIEDTFHGYDRLMQAVKGKDPVAVAVAYPVDDVSLGGALDAARAGLITPILVGPAAKIRALAQAHGFDLSAATIIDVADADDAAAKAVDLVRSGEAEAVMKGSLHSDELLKAVIDKARGLRTKRRMSHVFVMDVPTYPKALLVTDGALNIAPDLPTKRDICQNAIDLAHVMGNPLPKVAILAAVETVNHEMPATLDAAALCKMADRGQITGALLDGPLAFDNAVSLEAAQTKKIDSPVAGQADILVVPDLEAGNILAKQLTYLAKADAAGILLGASAPVILTSRADSVRTRMASCAVAVLLAHARRQDLGKEM